MFGEPDYSFHSQSYCNSLPEDTREAERANSTSLVSFLIRIIPFIFIFAVCSSLSVFTVHICSAFFGSSVICKAL